MEKLVPMIQPTDELEELLQYDEKRQKKKEKATLALAVAVTDKNLDAIQKHISGLSINIYEKNTSMIEKPFHKRMLYRFQALWFS